MKEPAFRAVHPFQVFKSVNDDIELERTILRMSSLDNPLSHSFSLPRSKQTDNSAVDSEQRMSQEIDSLVDYITDKIIIPMIEPVFRLSLIWDYMILALMYVEKAVTTLENSVEKLSIEPRQLRKAVIWGGAIVMICSLVK